MNNILIVEDEHLIARLIEMTLTRLADTWETPEAAEGIAAFLEKRKASWVPVETKP